MSQVIDIKEIDEFLKENPIDEELNYNAEFKYRLVKDGKLIGLIAYMLQKDEKGTIIPRFIHIILDKSVRRTRRAAAFVFSSIRAIQTKGDNQICAVIAHERTNMQQYARKFRFINYASDDKYTYWMLNLGKTGG